MMQKFAKFLFKLFGWKPTNCIPDIDKLVICIAPHTSNWDFFVGHFFYKALGLKSSFLIKDEWLRPPFGGWMRKQGAIGVVRSKTSTLTDQLTKKFNEEQHLHLAITPEGTRKRNPKWKKGFYYIAKKANVPILVLAMDYAKKEPIILDLFTPTDDEEADIKYIKGLYKDSVAKYPENFTTGL